jgi:hypothetical protein
VEVPLLGIHLNFRFGTSHIQMIAVSEVIGASLAAATTSAVVGLVVMHLAIGAAVIPAMARTARAR